jgi:cytochrome c-type biogenesis protein CcmH
MSFALTLAALAALAIALLLLPLRRKPNDTAAANDDQLRRLREFEADVAADEIDVSIAPGLREELERAVLDALPPSSELNTNNNRHGRATLAALCLAAPLAALGLYWKLGSPDLALFSADHPQLDWRKQATSIDYFVGRVRERLASHPDDVDAWTLLARTEMQLGHYQEALAAAERLNLVAPQQTPAMLLLVDALLMNGGDEHHSRAQALTAKVLSMEPQNPTALVMKGMFQQQEGDSAGALTTLQQALALAGKDSPLYAEIEQLIARAGGSVEATAPKAQVAVKVSVSLAPALASQAAPSDALFIAARALNGPPMPLAVSRHTVAELPLTITLDDSMAMVPGHSLAAVQQFYVVARVSHSGTATASSGDLEGKSATLDVKDAAEITLSIDRVLP